MDRPSSSITAEYFLSELKGIAEYESKLFKFSNSFLIALAVAFSSFVASTKVLIIFAKSFSLVSLVLTTFKTLRFPSVNVPVLSRHKVSTLAKVSIQYMS